MFFESTKQNPEELAAKHDLTLQELLIRIDGLDREIKTLLDGLDVTPEQISTFISNPDNFTEENWEELQKQRKMLDEKLSLEKATIPNPMKLKKTFAERNVAPHWLFVK